MASQQPFWGQPARQVSSSSPEVPEIKTPAELEWRDPLWHGRWTALKHKFNFRPINYKDCAVIAFVAHSKSLSIASSPAAPWWKISGTPQKSMYAHTHTCTDQTHTHTHTHLKILSPWCTCEFSHKQTLSTLSWKHTIAYIHTENLFPSYGVLLADTYMDIFWHTHSHTLTHTHTQPSLTQQCFSVGGWQSSPSFRPQVVNQTISSSHRDIKANCPHAAQLTFQWKYREERRFLFFFSFIFFFRLWQLEKSIIKTAAPVVSVIRSLGTVRRSSSGRNSMKWQSTVTVNEVKLRDDCVRLFFCGALKRNFLNHRSIAMIHNIRRQVLFEKHTVGSKEASPGLSSLDVTTCSFSIWHVIVNAIFQQHIVLFSFTLNEINT